MVKVSCKVSFLLLFYFKLNSVLIFVIWNRFVGLDNFCNDVEFMLKGRVNPYWRITWGIITPVFLIVIFVYFLATMQRLTYGDVDYPDIALGNFFFKEDLQLQFIYFKIAVCGWLIVGVTVFQLILWILYYIYVYRDQGWPEVRIKTSCKICKLF